jgi:hypothetical protein
MALCFKIKQLNIHESYFKGIVNFFGQEYTINIQDERRGKVLKLPFPKYPKRSEFLLGFQALRTYLSKTIAHTRENQNGWKLTRIKSPFSLLIIKTSLICLKSSQSLTHSTETTLSNSK